MDEFHRPVLLKEAIEGLNVKVGEKYIDATIGGGGHTREILERGGVVLGIDCDPEAIEYVKESLKYKLTLVRGNFAYLKKIAIREGFKKVAGILFDLGVSAYQLLTPKRGFSFNVEAPLDMRMDQEELKVTAADLINGLKKEELYALFTKLGEEHYSRAIARAIVRARALKPIKTCNELAEIVLKVRRKGRFDRPPALPAGRHPATRIFQALRIAVNDELNNLRLALPQAIELLEQRGKLAILSFHSLEDRIVKQFLKEKEREGVLKILTKKPIRPRLEEIEKNPRARSAKLRIAEKI